MKFFIIVDVVRKAVEIRSVCACLILGNLGGRIFDLAAKITGRKFPISSIRVKKFCADTLFETSIRSQTGFIPPVSLEEALERTIRYEFLEEHDEKVFYT